jgi:hypothetical protein
LVNLLNHRQRHGHNQAIDQLTFKLSTHWHGMPSSDDLGNSTRARVFVRKVLAYCHTSRISIRLACWGWGLGIIIRFLIVIKKTSLAGAYGFAYAEYMLFLLFLLFLIFNLYKTMIKK